MRLFLSTLASVALSACAGGHSPGAFYPVTPAPLIFYPMPTNNAAPMVAPAGPAVVGMGFLVRQRAGQSVTGQAILVCTYQYNGREFERGHQGFCPASVNVTQ